MIKIFFSLGFVVSFLLLCSTETYSQKLKAEEIISKNMDSIANKQTREKLKNYFAVGFTEFASKLPEKKAAGKIVLVSDVNNFYFLSSFNSKEYPFEKIGYFSEKVNLPFVIAGARSPLGTFILEHQNILSDGLIGGAMTMRWTLNKGKFVSAGTKKIDNQKAYVIEYYSDITSQEVSVKLFFDAETFRHVRTEYRHTIAEKQARFGALGQVSGLKQAVIEDFGDFKTVEGITLPHSYKIQYSTDSSDGLYEYNWAINITKYYFNQNLDANFYTFDVK